VAAGNDGGPPCAGCCSDVAVGPATLVTAAQVVLVVTVVARHVASGASITVLRTMRDGPQSSWRRPRAASSTSVRHPEGDRARVSQRRCVILKETARSVGRRRTLSAKAVEQP
jgi:hypothetical protein